MPPLTDEEYVALVATRVAAERDLDLFIGWVRSGIVAYGEEEGRALCVAVAQTKYPPEILASVAVVAAARLAEHAAAAAPVSPAGPHCQGCGHPLRPGEPVHVCHEHRTVMR